MEGGGDGGGDVGVGNDGDAEIAAEEVVAELDAREEVALPDLGHHQDLILSRHVLMLLLVKDVKEKEDFVG